MTNAADSLVFVVDDDDGMRDSISELVASIGIPVRAYPAATDFLSSYSPDKGGCLILDVRLRGMSGLELQDELVRRQVEIPIIVITGHADVSMAIRAMKAGAVDFLEKPFSGQALLDSVQRAIGLDDMRRRDRAEREAMAAKLAMLTRREREIADLLVAGKANKEVASQLGLSTRTVEGHRAHIMEKLGAASLAEVVRLTLGAVSHPGPELAARMPEASDAGVAGGAPPARRSERSAPA